MNRPGVMILAFFPLSVSLVLARACSGDQPAPPRTNAFLQAKTVFQTNQPYDPRLAIAVDAVIVHRHGASDKDLRQVIASWKEHGYPVGRMFFADSDAGNIYWRGGWDGRRHSDDVERNADGQVVRCAGTRPYMLPTDGWIRYLEAMTRQSIAAGADAILPEEPLAHVDTGYEPSFRELWRKRYGSPWRPESESAEARFLTAQLKNERYLELERRLAALTERESRRVGRDIAFVLPVHSLYSNRAAKLVAPLGTSRAIPKVDGVIGQVWTGPVRWALANYDSPQKSFFGSAYALYGYFAAMEAGGDRKLWLLVDPVEDDPHHRWSEFEAWYRHCVVASLLFPTVDAFEVMPWPDRIFLPGYATGGGTPAPERNRISILSAVQAQQEVPRSSHWELPSGGPPGVGIAVGDTLLWEAPHGPRLQGVYGLILPLVEGGAAVSSCLAERAGEPGYLDRFRVNLVSFDAWKPAGEDTNRRLIDWARRGGTLIVLGNADRVEGTSFWWRRFGRASPLHDLLAAVGMDVEKDDERAIGRGRIWRRCVSPARFANPDTARRVYLPLVDRGLRAAGVERGLDMRGSFLLRRGPFVIAHASTRPLDLLGPLVDLLDPDLPLHDGVHLAIGQSGLYRDVRDLLEGHQGAALRLLHATHRVVETTHHGTVLRIRIRGPVGTPGVARIYAPNGIRAIEARRQGGDAVDVDQRRDSTTFLLRFPNAPGGVTLRIE